MAAGLVSSRAADEARAPGPWSTTYERVVSVPPATRTAADLDALADALFWLDRPDESMEARRAAYAAHLAAGSSAGAARAAWRLFYDHFLVGEASVANGWIARARQHATESAEAAPAAWVAIAEADLAMTASDADGAVRWASVALDAARDLADNDLLAMAHQTVGRALVHLGRITEGMAHLDEAMVAVTAGDLDPLYAGWVYCNLLSSCRDLADMRRATEWSDAAARWCDALAEGRLYPGICRVHAVEFACLRGAWAEADAECRRACEELVAHDPRYAGEAFYLTGELRRLAGDLDGAEEAFTRAHELGRVPQPGLARVRLAQGRAGAAVKALRLALAAGPHALLQQAQLLAACVEAELALDEVAAAEATSSALVTVAEQSGAPFLVAMASSAVGAVRLGRGDPAGALVPLRRACSLFQDLGFPHEVARTQVAIGVATREAGDEDTAVLELGAALAAFERLGATADAERARALVSTPARPTPLTDREIEVIRLLARGGTNREIGAELFLSEHTIARHVSNIFTKIGVSSRAAATAYAYDNGLI